MEKRDITKNDMTVSCYGEWKWDSNCVVIGYWNDGSELDEIYADGADSWEEVVDILTTWATRNGLTIVELQSC